MSETSGPGNASPAAGTLTQDGRLIAIETHLGKDRLLLASLSGEEALSELFSYQIEMFSADQAISAESLIGRAARLVITSEDGKTRPIHGVFAELRAGPLVGRGLRQYRAQLVPWLWFLGHTTDCRIYQNLSVPEIIEQVFGAYGCTDFKMAVARGDYAKREFCVQYRESALNFVSRLMEEEGILYFFQHEADRHVMVIADSNAKFPKLPEPKLTYAPGSLQSGHITAWEHSYQFRPGRWAQKDFNFEAPSTDLTTLEKTILKLRSAQTFERYDYPGRYIEKDLGTKQTRKLMEAEEAAHHAVRGAGNYPGLDAGGRFMLQSHPLEDDSKEYVVRRVRHVANNSDYFSMSGDVARYDNTFEAIPYEVPFRPMRVAEKPFVHGPQTAIVVGPPGEKIFTDKHGRVRVQFHWDRYGKKDDKSSCWIRVSQSWAGRGWGNVNLPHVGHEVVVSFLEGDPDCPLVTGRVYNGENMTAMGMPDSKTQSAIRDHAGNEIVMEGKSGSEDIRINATKDTNVVVTHDYNETVKTGNRKIDIVSGTHTETIKGNTSITVTSGAYAHYVADNRAQRVSKQSNVMASTDADVYVQAATSIQLHVGASTLTMDKDGNVQIKGNDIILDAKTISLSGKTSVETVGGQVNATAQGTHTIKGALVKIN